MRKFLISIISIFIGFSVFAAGENVTTSKSYVDSALVPKQDIIEGTNDSPRVLTNTGTAGEYGTKDIYDSTDTYSGQMDALIDAVTMNTAVQNAIDSEFQCVEYNPNDPTDCWLMDIRGMTETRSKNLFDINKVPTRNPGSTDSIVHNADGSITVTTSPGNGAVRTYTKLSVLAPEIIANEPYTLSFDTTGTGKYIYFSCIGHTSDNRSWSANSSITVTENLLDCGVNFYASGSNTTATISNIQIERGNTATPYQPYGNIYVPATTSAEP